jgi:hypothetical protein
MAFYIVPLFLLTACILFVIRNRSRTRPPPGYISAPGPKGLPILGNAHQLTAQPHRMILKWSREYGEVYKIRLGWNDWYMLCSPGTVKEILVSSFISTVDLYVLLWI